MRDEPLPVLEELENDFWCLCNEFAQNAKRILHLESSCAAHTQSLTTAFFTGCEVFAAMKYELLYAYCVRTGQFEFIHGLTQGQWYGEINREAAFLLWQLEPQEVAELLPEAFRNPLYAAYAEHLGFHAMKKTILHACLEYGSYE